MTILLNVVVDAATSIALCEATVGVDAADHQQPVIERDVSFWASCSATFKYTPTYMVGCEER